MEQQYLVVRTTSNELKRGAVNPEQARLFQDKTGQTIVLKGRKVEVLGVFTEEEYKAAEIFHPKQTSDHYKQWVQNMKHLKEKGEWPEIN